MIRRGTIIALFFVCLGIIFVMSVLPVRAAVDAPTVVRTGGGTLRGIDRTFVAGLTPAGTDVLVFLNGEPVGSATVRSEETPTDSFYFEPEESLPAGKYELAVAARDQSSEDISPVVVALVFSVVAPPSPTLFGPNENTVTGKVKPDITGLTVSGSLVHIWIDGIYNGKTGILEHESGTADFAYKPFLNLNPGHHKVRVIAEDKAGRKSLSSDILSFVIEPPMPAPVLVMPENDSLIDDNLPRITGVTKNKTQVKIFIDNELNGFFTAGEDESGAVSFGYEPFLPLAPGRHSLYAVAVDSRGKESRWSDIAYFTVTGTRGSQGTISESAALEIAKAVDSDSTYGDGPKITIEPLEGGDTVTDKQDDYLNELLAGENTSAVLGETGSINEIRQKQGKLGLNTVIFILFLLSVIAWIFWVNRELIRERRAMSIFDDDD